MAKALSEEIFQIIWRHKVNQHGISVFGEFLKSDLTRTGRAINVLLTGLKLFILLVNGEHKLSQLGHENSFFVNGQRVAKVHQDVFDGRLIMVGFPTLCHLFDHN